MEVPGKRREQGPLSRLQAEVGRRSFLKAAGVFGLLAAVPSRILAEVASSLPGPGENGRYLGAHELDTLRALSSRLVPGPPEDSDPGALEAGAAEAIDLLLAAFECEPPLIHAGGPFSDRAGAARNDFADFVPLDPLTELGWRIRIEGSKGLPAREFAGPVRGLQEIYRAGLAHLDDRAQQAFGADFMHLSANEQDLLLSDALDRELQDFLGAAFANVLEAMYGPPEYGGNRGLVGWGYTNWDGDVQPDGYEEAQVSEPQPGSSILTASEVEAFHRLAVTLGGRAAPRHSWWLGRNGLRWG